MATQSATTLLNAVDVLLAQATACSDYARTPAPTLAAYNLLFLKKDPTEVTLTAMLSDKLSGATSSTLKTIATRQASIRALLDKDIARLNQRTLSTAVAGVVNKDIKSLSANINLLNSLISWATRYASK